MARYSISISNAQGRYIEFPPFDAINVAAAKRRHAETLRALHPQMIWTHEIGAKRRLVAIDSVVVLTPIEDLAA